MRVLVTGGTGDLGRRVVDRLKAAGHEVLVGTRAPGEKGQVRFDLASPPDPGMLEGVDTVVHLATDPLASKVDTSGSDRLWEVAKAAGVSHAIYVSIVGIDDHPYPYYRTKLIVERQLEESGLPYTVLRTTQFHGLVPRLVDEAIRRLGMVPVPPGIRLQPIDPEVVADRVAELVETGPSGRVPEMGGPEVLELDHMVRSYLEATGRKVLRFPVPLWGAEVAAFRRGDHLAPRARSGGRSYREYLAELTRPADPGVAKYLRVVGAALLGTALWMLVAPAGFHSRFAGFGELNSHYIRDTATFILPLALALWLAAARPAWRTPVLVLALLQNGAHILNHIADVGRSDPDWHGPLNLALLGLLQVALWWLYRNERRRARQLGH